MIVINAPIVAGTKWKSRRRAVHVNLNCSSYIWKWRSQNTGRRCCTLTLWLKTNTHHLPSCTHLYLSHLQVYFEQNVNYPDLDTAIKTSIIV